MIQKAPEDGIPGRRAMAWVPDFHHDRGVSPGKHDLVQGQVCTRASPGKRIPAQEDIRTRIER